jgi:hypothetical protein
MTDRSKQESATDQPTMKPRKLTRLWAAYLYYADLRDMRTARLLRISAGERGASNLDVQFERDRLEETQLDALIEGCRKVMIDEGKRAGFIWKWLTGIRGLGEGTLAGQLLAQIDDPALFVTVSKLWRFCGYAVIDGAIDKRVAGEKAHYNARLKSILWQIVEQFIRHQTPGYVDLYYAEKERQRAAHPVPVCLKCGVPGSECHVKGHGMTFAFTDKHIHLRAMRKVSKVFLQHLWVTWRESEGLPVSEPYVQAIMGHTNIMPPLATGREE